jgi:hypothetical protein
VARAAYCFNLADLVHLSHAPSNAVRGQPIRGDVLEWIATEAAYSADVLWAWCWR